MRLADLNKMEVKVDVNENDIIRVNIGDTAEIEVDAFINEKFKGIVTSIASSANVSGLSIDQVTNFEVKIKVLQESYAHLNTKNIENFYPLRPGMSASVEIMTTKRDNVLSVPIQAVTTREDSVMLKNKPKETIDEDGDIVVENNRKAAPVKEIVFIYDKGVVKTREVKTGIQDNNYIQIIEGLKKGEEIVAGPYRAVSRNLKDGTKVKKVEKDKIKLD